MVETRDIEAERDYVFGRMAQKMRQNPEFSRDVDELIVRRGELVGLTDAEHLHGSCRSWATQRRGLS